MKKLVDGKVVDLSAAEAEARLRDCDKGAAEALAHVKKAIIERMDAKLFELQRQTWMASTKAQIMAAATVQQVRAIFETVSWEVPKGDAPAVREPVYLPSGYDDEWIREAFAEVAVLVAKSVYDDTELRVWLENLERRIAVLERVEAVIDVDPAPPLVDESPPLTPGDWRKAIQAMDDEDFGIGQEADPEPEVEPELELPEPVIEKPEPVKSQTVVITEEKTITDSVWGKAQIRYETAIQAFNGNSRARALLMLPAERRGISVLELAEEIMRERDETVQQVMSEF